MKLDLSKLSKPIDSKRQERLSKAIAAIKESGAPEPRFLIDIGDDEFPLLATPEDCRFMKDVGIVRIED